MLKDYGLTPDDITDVSITHMDFDHVGDIQFYNNANIYIHRDEMKERGPIGNKSKVHTFDTCLQVYDRFMIKHIGGHTIGSSIVTFPYGQSTYVLGGDECYVDASLERQIPTGRSCDAAKSRAFIEKYSQPEYVVWLCHEPGVVEGDTEYRIILP